MKDNLNDPRGKKERKRKKENERERNCAKKKRTGGGESKRSNFKVKNENDVTDSSESKWARNKVQIRR